jgi:two-component system, sporulation sensor kinase E
LLNAEALLTEKVIELKLRDIPAVKIDEKDVSQLILNIAINGWKLWGL